MPTAVEGYQLLHKAGVPFGVAPGNHDYDAAWSVAGYPPNRDKVWSELEHTVESSDLSLNATVDSEHPVEYVESLTAAEERIDEQLARGELKELFDRNVQEFAQSLNDRERAILFERLIAEEPKTLQKIADQFQVTREAIRLSEKKLIEKVKAHMELAFADVTQFELDLIR